MVPPRLRAGAEYSSSDMLCGSLQFGEVTNGAETQRNAAPSRLRVGKMFPQFVQASCELPASAPACDELRLRCSGRIIFLQMHREIPAGFVECQGGHLIAFRDEDEMHSG